MPSTRCLVVLLALAAATAAPALPLREDLAERLAERTRRVDLLPPRTRVARDIRYGAHPQQALDVYVGDDGPANRPVIVMVHGGGWRGGDKASPGVVGAKAARWLPRGFVLVSVNYRLLPDHGPLAQADDVARALARVQERAAAWGGDPSRIVLMGHSSGAHLVALLSADPARWRLRPWLGTVALDGVAYDLEAQMRERHFRMYDAAFGSDPATWRAASPSAALKAGAVPLLAVCSRTRRDRPCTYNEAYVKRIRGLGVRAEVLGAQLDHAGINRELGRLETYTRAVERFMASLDAEVARRLEPAR